MAALATSVERILGVELDPSGSRLGLADAIEDGLSVDIVDRLADVVAPGDPSFRRRLIPKATLERRRKSSSRRLTSEEGDRIVRLTQVFSFALNVFKSADKAEAFLRRPHAMLDGRAPRDVALATGLGAEIVTNLLGRAAYGGGV